jgi:hypothetical protein
MSTDSEPITSVKINRQTEKAIFAQVNNTYQVWINNMGTDKFQYSCSCKQWANDFENGHLRYCSHFLAVIAKLELVDRIADETQINLIDEEGSKRIIEYKKVLLEIRKRRSEKNQLLISQGKMLLCDYCKRLPGEEICNPPNTPRPLYINEIKPFARGLIIRGTGPCLRCGKILKIANKVSFELSSDLRCPNCGKNDFKISLMNAKRVNNGYKFSVQLHCNNRKCNWSKTIKSNIQSIYNLISKVKRVKVSTNGFEIEAK